MSNLEYVIESSTQDFSKKFYQIYLYHKSRYELEKNELSQREEFNLGEFTFKHVRKDRLKIVNLGFELIKECFRVKNNYTKVFIMILREKSSIEEGLPLKIILLLLKMRCFQVKNKLKNDVLNHKT